MGAKLCKQVFAAPSGANTRGTDSDSNSDLGADGPHSPNGRPASPAFSAASSEEELDLPELERPPVWRPPRWRFAGAEDTMLVEGCHPPPPEHGIAAVHSPPTLGTLKQNSVECHAAIAISIFHDEDAPEDLEPGRAVSPLVAKSVRASPLPEAHVEFLPLPGDDSSEDFLESLHSSRSIFDDDEEQEELEAGGEGEVRGGEGEGAEEEEVEEPLSVRNMEGEDTRLFSQIAFGMAQPNRAPEEYPEPNYANYINTVAPMPNGDEPDLSGVNCGDRTACTEAQGRGGEGGASRRGRRRGGHQAAIRGCRRHSLLDAHL